MNKDRHQNWPITAIVGLLIITVLASVPLTLTVLHHQESDALVIDIAGRQRMLLERYMKELLLAAQGVPAGYEDTRRMLARAPWREATDPLEGIAVYRDQPGD